MQVGERAQLLRDAPRQLRSKKCRSVRREESRPSQEGIVPARYGICDSSRYDKELSSASVEGSVPPTLVCDKSSKTKEDNLPNSGGIVPVQFVRDKPRYISEDMSPSSRGSEPDKFD